MEQLKRLKEIVEYLKGKHKYATNEDLARALRYETPNYISDILGGTKPINRIFLKRLSEQFAVNTAYIIDGTLPMIHVRPISESALANEVMNLSAFVSVLTEEVARMNERASGVSVAEFLQKVDRNRQKKVKELMKKR